MCRGGTLPPPFPDRPGTEHVQGAVVILIVLKASIKPDKREEWLKGITSYTAAVRSEPGNVSFDFYENAQDSNEFVIVETFRDGDAGGAHVATEHAQNFFPWMGGVVTRKPYINYQDLDGDAWNEMAEVEPR
jgi:quinol monooxygenase YgiN